MDVRVLQDCTLQKRRNYKFRITLSSHQKMQCPQAVGDRREYLMREVHCRGSLGFGEDCVQSLLGNIGTNDVADCIAALDAAIEQGVLQALLPVSLNPIRVPQSCLKVFLPEIPSKIHAQPARCGPAGLRIYH